MCLTFPSSISSGERRDSTETDPPWFVNRFTHGDCRQDTRKATGRPKVGMVRRSNCSLCANWWVLLLIAVFAVLLGSVNGQRGPPCDVTAGQGPPRPLAPDTMTCADVLSWLPAISPHGRMPASQDHGLNSIWLVQVRREMFNSPQLDVER